MNTDTDTQQYPGQQAVPPGTYQQGPGAPGGYQPGQYPGRYSRAPIVQPKSPGIALLLSLLIPGVGSMYAGRVSGGLGTLVVYLIGWVLTPLHGLGFPISFCAWVWGMFAGYRDARRWNAAHGIIS